MDKVASLRAFVKVVETGSFAEAGRQLRLSRSAVSKYIAELEQSLGVQLLNRTTRHASPNETGNQWKLTGADGDQWIQPSWSLCVNNAEVRRDVAIRGHGVALIPSFIASAALEKGAPGALLTPGTSVTKFV